MKNVSGTRSRPVVSTALFLAAVLGQVWFWRKLLFGGSLAGQPPVLYVELAFLAVILALALLTARPRGLGGKKRCAAALAGFALYAVFNVVNIRQFAAFNMTSSDSSYESLGPALVALKLFIVLAGVIAAMPVAPAIAAARIACWTASPSTAQFASRSCAMRAVLISMPSRPRTRLS